MTSRVSCIEHRAKSLIVMIREDYYRLMNCDRTAAALLNVFEYWANGSIAINGDQVDIAIGERTVAEMEQMTLWQSTDKKIRQILQLLEARKYISISKGETYTSSRNYTFHPSVVQEDLKKLDWDIDLKDLKKSNPTRQKVEVNKPTGSRLTNRQVAVNKPTGSRLTNRQVAVNKPDIYRNKEKDLEEERITPVVPLKGELTKQQKSNVVDPEILDENHSNSQEGNSISLVVNKISASDLDIPALFEEIEKANKLSDDELCNIYLEVYKFAKPSNFVNHKRITKQHLKKIKSWVKEYGDRGALQMFYEALTVIREQKDPWWRVTEKFELKNLLSNGKIESLADKHQMLMATEPDYRDRVNGDAPSLDVVRASKGEHGTEKQAEYEARYEQHVRAENAQRFDSDLSFLRIKR